VLKVWESPCKCTGPVWQCGNGSGKRVATRAARGAFWRAQSGEKRKRNVAWDLPDSD
jgi:hypothetical protein